ncbi:uncharacterized protein LOC141854790 isoform X2 [Brevipalpus obovatus]|uniref:uncharacterized protein LOC141854790 isoform X2 n=1 Tax=Brevipalpus obovatus TaxID=246614 RepID=UPI003D9ECBF4
MTSTICHTQRLTVKARSKDRDRFQSPSRTMLSCPLQSKSSKFFIILCLWMFFGCNIHPISGQTTTTTSTPTPTSTRKNDDSITPSVADIAISTTNPTPLMGRMNALKANNKSSSSNDTDILRGQEQGQSPLVRNRGMGQGLGGQLGQTLGQNAYGLPFSSFIPQGIPFSGSSGLGGRQGNNQANGANNNGRPIGPLDILSGFIPSAPGLGPTTGPYGITGPGGLGYPGTTPGYGGIGSAYNQNPGLNNQRGLGLGGQNSRGPIGGNTGFQGPVADSNQNEVEPEQGSGEDDSSGGESAEGSPDYADQNGADESGADGSNAGDESGASGGNEDSNGGQGDQDPSKDPDLAQFQNLQGGNFPADLFPPGILSQQDLNDIQKSIEEQQKKEAEKKQQEEAAQNQDYDQNNGGEGDGASNEGEEGEEGGGAEEPEKKNAIGQGRLPNYGQTGPQNFAQNLGQGQNGLGLQNIGSLYGSRAPGLGNQLYPGTYPGNGPIYPGAEGLGLGLGRGQLNNQIGNQGVTGNDDIRSRIPGIGYDSPARPWNSYGSGRASPLDGLAGYRQPVRPAHVEYDRSSGGGRAFDYLGDTRGSTRGRNRFSSDEDEEEDDDDYRRPSSFGGFSRGHGRRPDYGSDSLNSVRQNEIEPGVNYEQDARSIGRSSGRSGIIPADDRRSRQNVNRLNGLRPSVQYTGGSGNRLGQRFPGISSSSRTPGLSSTQRDQMNTREGSGHYHSLPPSNRQDSLSMKNRQSHRNRRPNESFSAADYEGDDLRGRSRGSHNPFQYPSNRKNFPTSSQASYEDENDSNVDNLTGSLPSYRQTPRFVASHREEVQNHDGTLNQDPSNLDSHKSANANPFLSG